MDINIYIVFIFEDVILFKVVFISKGISIFEVIFIFEVVFIIEAVFIFLTLQTASKKNFPYMIQKLPYVNFENRNAQTD